LIAAKLAPQGVPYVRARTVCRAFETCIDKPKVENCNCEFHREASLCQRAQQCDGVFAPATNKSFFTG
jgi:hypothetical protein